MVEISNLQICAELDLSGIGFDFAKQKFDQRTLSNAVVSDQSEPIATHELEIEIAYDGVSVKELAKADSFADDFAAFFTSVDLEIDAAHAVSTRRALASKFFKAAHTAFIAGPPGFDALAAQTSS